MNNLTVADFVESHSDIISISVDGFKIQKNKQSYLSLILSVLLKGATSLKAGPSCAGLTVEGAEYTVDQSETCKKNRIVLIPSFSKDARVEIPICEFINIFAHCEIPNTENCVEIA